MEERSLKENQIAELIARLFNREEAVYQEAFQSLCLYFSDEDILFIYERLKERGDNWSFHWLVKYLVSVERPAGFEKLYALLAEGNEWIREQVCSRLSEISLDPRADLLLKMLDLPWEKEVRFAVGYLGKLRQSRTVVPLLELLEKEKDKETQIMILKALGRIRDPRAFTHLEQWANRDDRDIQEEALASLSWFALALHTRYLKRYLASPYLRIRQIAYQAALRQKTRYWETYITKGLEEEKDEKTVIMILSSVRGILTEPLFRAVFRKAFSDPSPKIRMMAQSTIRRIKSGRILKWLMRNEKGESLAAAGLRLRLLASYGAAGKIFEILTKRYLRGSKNCLRLIALENLAGSADARAVPFLCKLILGRNEFSYAAVNTLAPGLKERHWLAVEGILSETGGEPFTAIIQALLATILRLPARQPLPRPVEKTVERLMKAGSRHVRYLAVRCFSRIAKDGKTARLLEMAGRESDFSIRLAALKGLREIFKHSPELLGDIIPEAAGDETLSAIAEVFFKNVRMSGEHFVRTAKTLIYAILEARSEAGGEKFLRVKHLETFLKQSAAGHRDFFLKMVNQGVSGREEKDVLARMLPSIAIRSFSELSPRFLDSVFESGTAEAKIAILDFLKNLPLDERKPAEEVLFGSFLRERDKKVRSKMNEVISFWTEPAFAENSDLPG
ncbi:MAG TPA: HEAT repeat domain-containing protein [Candidatus Omnitrophota bacterium]|nr:HEAT repeat domain-containing protein [Candidatus Omnitrophota bacterium]